MTEITTQTSTQTGNSILKQLNSGTDGVLDVESVVESLLLGETGIQINGLNKEIEELKTKETAFELLGSALQGFDGIMNDLSTKYQDIKKAASILDESLASVSVSNDVSDGSYSLEVLSLASKQSLSSSVYSSSSDLVGSGTITIETGSFSGGPFSGNGDAINISVSSTTTVAQLVDDINTSGAGVNAYLINTGSGYQIAMSSKSTGESGGFAVSVVDSDGNSTDSNGLSSLNYHDGVQHQTLNQAASNAQALFDGVLINSQSNTFDNVVPGFTFDVKKTNVGSPSFINVANDVDGARDIVIDFIESYNAVADVMDYLSGEEEGEESQGALFRDSDFKLVESAFRKIAEEYVAGYGGTAVLNQLGVRFTKDNTGQLELNEEAFSAAIASDADIVKNAMAQIGTPTDSNITFLSATEDTVAGNYSPINITTVASGATLVGGASGTLTIHSLSDEFSATVNGESTGTIFLTNKTYADYDEMAAEIQAKMNAALVNNSVSVTHNGSGFEIANSVLGSVSTISIDSGNTYFQSATGLSNGSSASGTDVIGNVGGGVAVGTGNVLEVITGDALGLKLKVDATTTGTYGSIEVTDGIGKTFSDIIDSFFSSQGVYTQILQRYDSSLEDKEERVSKLEARTEELRVRYSVQYAELNAFIVAMDQTSSQLQSQFDAWNQN